MDCTPPLTNDPLPRNVTVVLNRLIYQPVQHNMEGQQGACKNSVDTKDNNCETRLPMTCLFIIVLFSA